MKGSRQRGQAVVRSVSLSGWRAARREGCMTESQRGRVAERPRDCVGAHVEDGSRRSEPHAGGMHTQRQGVKWMSATYSTELARGNARGRAPPEQAGKQTTDLPGIHSDGHVGREANHRPLSAARGLANGQGTKPQTSQGHIRAGKWAGEQTTDL